MKLYILNVFLVIVSLILGMQEVYCWDGMDEDGHLIEIDEGNTVREGNEIDVYDYTDGTFHTVDVDSVYRIGNTVSIDAYDFETNELKTYDMDD